MYVLTVRFVTMTTNPIDDCDFFYRCSSNGNLITQPAEHFPASNLADPIPTPRLSGWLRQGRWQIEVQQICRR